MRIAYLECFAGIAGDMFLGALVDAGVDPAVLQRAADALNLGVTLDFQKVDRSGIQSTKARVLVDGLDADGGLADESSHAGTDHKHADEHAQAHTHSHADGTVHTHSHADGTVHTHSHADGTVHTHAHADATADTHSHADGTVHNHSHSHESSPTQTHDPYARTCTRTWPKPFRHSHADRKHRPACWREAHCLVCLREARRGRSQDPRRLQWRPSTSTRSGRSTPSSTLFAAQLARTRLEWSDGTPAQ